MNNKITCAIAFILGAGVGSVVAWQLLKTKYEQILDDELEAMEEYYQKKDDLPVFTVKEEEPVPTDEEKDEAKNIAEGFTMYKAHVKEKPDIQELVAELEKHGYSNVQPITKEEQDDEQLEFSLVNFDSEGNVKRALHVANGDGTELITEEGEDIVQSEPYVITPEEFGENEDYNTVSLTYYADHILTYEDGDIVEDVDGLVGEESLTHFGEYEDDSVFVRNDVCKTDYEILLDEREYMDIRDSNVYPGDDE